MSRMPASYLFLREPRPFDREKSSVSFISVSFETSLYYYMKIIKLISNADSNELSRHMGLLISIVHDIPSISEAYKRKLKYHVLDENNKNVILFKYS